MYRNLEAELARKGVSRKMIADVLQININTVSAKLTGRSPFLWDEVEAISKHIFNDELDIKYLFDKSA